MKTNTQNLLAATILAARSEAFQLIKKRLDDFVVFHLTHGSTHVGIMFDDSIALDVVRTGNGKPQTCTVNGCHRALVLGHFKNNGLSVESAAWGDNYILSA